MYCDVSRLGSLLLLLLLLVVEYHQTREDRHHHLALHLNHVLGQRVDARAFAARQRYRVLGVAQLLLYTHKQNTSHTNRPQYWDSDRPCILDILTDTPTISQQ